MRAVVVAVMVSVMVACGETHEATDIPPSESMPRFVREAVERVDAEIAQPIACDYIAAAFLAWVCSIETDPVSACDGDCFAAAADLASSGLPVPGATTCPPSVDVVMEVSAECTTPSSALACALTATIAADFADCIN